MATASVRHDIPLERPSASRYMPQLDSVRTIAVLGVMLHHFWPKAESAIGLSTGFLGVQLFFVLSGFLITGILLRARDLVQLQLESTSTAVRQFYIRRFLRIVPLFYVTLFVAWIVGLPEVRDSLAWHLSYTTNIYFVRIEDWHGSVSHFWSLAVEEQFYLVWPFAIVLAPRRVLFPLLMFVVFLAPAFRVFGALTGLHWMVWFVLPFANCDALGLGAVLAYASSARWGSGQLYSGVLRAGLWVGLPFVLALWFLEFNQLWWPATTWFRTAFENTVWGLFFVWLIDGAARGFGGPFGWLLRRRPLIYLGKISYGLYVIHPFMARVVPWAYARLGVTEPVAGPVAFCVLAAATILVAAASWTVYERPINDLKRYFSYA